MSANLYDLLNVDESATADEIRAAWKAAIADLEPSDRRFRAYNDAAGVLLDDDLRASYDAELAQARADEPDVDTAAPVAVDTTVATTAAAPADDAAEEPSADSAQPSAGPSSPALIGVGVAAVLAIALTLWILSLAGVRDDVSPKEVAERASTQERAMLSAESAAEQMVAPVLSYNHKTMAEDLERLKGFVTPQMAEKQERAWPDLTQEAEAQEIVVEASSAGTAVTRVDAGGKRATVVVFIDQAVVKKANESFVLQMWATMSLVRDDSANGRWLLDDLCTDNSCG